MCLGLTPGEAVWAAVDSNHLPPRSLALSAVLTRSEAECKSGCYLALTTAVYELPHVLPVRTRHTFSQPTDSASVASAWATT